MNNVLYFIAAILFFCWAVGYIGFQSGVFIHLLLVLGFIALILRLIMGKKGRKFNSENEIEEKRICASAPSLRNQCKSARTIL